MSTHLAYGLSGGPLECCCPVGRDHARTDFLYVRGEHAPGGAGERCEVLVARERAAAAAKEREDCAQRVYAWAAGLSKEHDRLVAAAAAEVVLEGR